jgi:putative ABC transport system permease protein
MRPRWRKVFSDLWGNRTRSLLVVASIAVGLFAIGVIATLYLVMSNDMRLGYLAGNPANIHADTGLFDQEMVDHLERLPEVRQAEGSRQFSVRLLSDQGEWITLAMKTAGSPGQGEISQVKLLEGSWPPGEGQVVLEASKLSNAGEVQVGEAVTVELPSGRERQLQVTGIVQDQTLGAFEGGSGGFFTAPLQGFIHQDSLEWLEQPRPELYNALYATVESGADHPAHIEEVASLARDELEDGGVEVVSTYVRSSYDHPNRTLTDAIVGVLFVLGLLVVFLSGFLITNTLQALLDQQREQLGVMKTVGARRLQISGIYMALIAVLGLLALAISLPLANLAAYRLMMFLAAEINIILGAPRLIPSVVALQAILALLVPQVAGFLPIWQGTRISVQEALSGIRQSSAQGQGTIDRFLGRVRSLSRPMRISLRNAFRRKGRLLLTLITLTLGGAVFIATFNVQVSMGKQVDGIMQYFLADANLVLERPYRISKMQGELAGLPGVQRVEGWAAARSELVLPDGSAGESVKMLAPPAGTDLVTPILMEGRWIEPGDTNAITLNDRFLTTHPDLDVGETLLLRVNGKDTEWKIVGFFQLAGKVSGHLAYGSYDYLSELIGQPNQAAVFRIEAQPAYLEQFGQEHLVREIEAHLRQGGIDIEEINTGSFMSETASEGFAILTAFLLFLAVLTALVGSIGLAGTMSMNVMERTREIGVMRAVGASNSILMKMVIVEGMIIGLVSWLLGTLLAFPISKVMADSIAMSLFDSPSNLGFTPTGFILWLGAVIVLSVLASVMPARKAARLTIREVLAYE